MIGTPNRIEMSRGLHRVLQQSYAVIDTITAKKLMFWNENRLHVAQKWNANDVDTLHPIGCDKVVLPTVLIVA